MKLISLEFENTVEEWKLEKTDFGDLTLLVGGSGVGKTQILNAILTLKRIVQGESLSGVSWKITFSVGSQEYTWKGIFAADSTNFNTVGANSSLHPVLLSETLSLGEEEVVRKEVGKVHFYGKETEYRQSPNQSVFTSIYEDEVQKARKAWGQMQESYQHNFDLLSFAKDAQTFGLNYQNILQEFDSVQKIRTSPFHILVKLAIAYRTAPEVFAKFKDEFQRVFPQITDVRFEPAKGGYWPQEVEYIPHLQFQVAGVSRWIDRNQLSSGMQRTQLHLAETLLSPDGTVFLIDEFETSLGINCIDEVTDSVLNESGRLQFIITSHHPYVINNIGFEFWKIVTRKGGVISTHDASELIQAKSKHDRFLQLYNYKKYQQGIDAA